LSKSFRNFLKTQFNLSETQIFVSSGLVGAGDLSEIVSRLPSALLYPEYTPRFPQRIVDFKGDCFASIRNKDIIVHHPYESFDVVVRFLEQAARDPDVLAIRQTLYRTSPQSPIAKALVEAAENGKTVMALIELKARFDEKTIFN
jgi:polyphosphate kinase